MRLHIISFGYRNRKPELEAVYDCRSIANPHRLPGSRRKNGFDRSVIRFVMKDPTYHKIYNRAISEIQQKVEAFQPEIYVGFGCVGGKHRSVVLADAVATFFRDKGVNVDVFHRELREFR